MNRLAAIALLACALEPVEAAPYGSYEHHIKLPPQLVHLGQPSANGNLDKAYIRRYIKRKLAEITSCYVKALDAHPSLQGTVSTQFTIEATGLVSHASGSGMDAKVAACVASVIATIQFPQPTSGTVSVTYPFVFALPPP